MALKEGWEKIIICSNCVYYTPIDLLLGRCEPLPDDGCKKILSPLNRCEVWRPIDEKMNDKIFTK